MTIRSMSRPTQAGLAIVFVAGLAVLGPHVRAGGFHADDWVDASNYYLHPGHGFWAALRNAHNINRGAWALLRTANFAVLGMHSARHLALTAAVAIAEACALLVAARKLGLGTACATLMALLLLALPDADSTRLWASGLQMELFAGLLPLAGLLVALAGLERKGLLGAVLHCLALVLYALSVNGYELAAPMIALFGFIYWWRAPGRGSRIRWAADVAVVVAVLIPYAAKRSPQPLSQVPHHLQIIVTDGLGVIARALLPVPGVPPAAVLGPALAIVASAAIATFNPRVDARVRVEARRTLRVLAAGLVVTAAGWVMIIPADLGYDPGSAGVGNRINAVAAIGVAVTVVAAARLVATAIRARSRLPPLPLSLLTGILVIPVIAGDVIGLERDAAHWNRAADENRTFLVRLRQVVPTLAHGATVFTFGIAGYSAPSVPIFGGGGNNDLLGAVRVAYGTAAISGFPVLSGMRFSCDSKTMALSGTGASSTTPYGLALLVDMRRTGSALIPRSRQDCLQETARLMPYASVNETN